MAKDGMIHQNPLNEVNNKDPNKPDSMGDDLYFGGWPEIMKMHLSETGPMVDTPNSRSGGDVMGGPAKGEPNPGKMGGKG